MIGSTKEFITRRVDSKKKLQTAGVSYLMIMSSHEVLLKAYGKDTSQDDFI